MKRIAPSQFLDFSVSYHIMSSNSLNGFFNCSLTSFDNGVSILSNSLLDFSVGYHSVFTFNVLPIFEKAFIIVKATFTTPVLFLELSLKSSFGFQRNFTLIVS